MVGVQKSARLPPDQYDSVNRVLRFADALDESPRDDPCLAGQLSPLRALADHVLTLVGAMDREASRAGHGGPSRAEADELEIQQD
ncbi:unnamed protein product, partial [Laminaria digitata]